MIRGKTYTKWAFRHGRREHLFGRLQILPAAVGGTYNYFKPDRINLYIFMAVLVCQIIYLLSHKMEKFCFRRGDFKPRG